MFYLNPPRLGSLQDDSLILLVNALVPNLLVLPEEAVQDPHHLRVFLPQHQFSLGRGNFVNDHLVVALSLTDRPVLKISQSRLTTRMISLTPELGTV